MNRIENYAPLKNRYFALRHGTSVANEESKIVSNPKIGTEQYGLSEAGEKQIESTIQEFKSKKSPDPKDIVIISSDFLRTKETAEITATILNTENIIYKTGLRERFFGKFDMQDHSYYKSIWDLDDMHSGHTLQEVEAPEDVETRVTEVIEEAENIYENKTIILVSHGDSLQILQAAFQKVSPYEHRTMNHINTGEIRELKLQE